MERQGLIQPKKDQYHGRSSLRRTFGSMNWQGVLFVCKVLEDVQVLCDRSVS